MPLTFVEDQPDTPVHTHNVYSSARAERSFQVMTDTPSKAVNVYSSARAEKNFKVLTDTPSKPVSVYSSSRAERSFKTMDGTPSKAVSVFNSRIAESWHTWFSGNHLPTFVEDEPEIDVEKIPKSKATECEGYSEAWAWLAAKKWTLLAPLDNKWDLVDDAPGSPLQRSYSMAEPCPELSPMRAERTPRAPGMVL